MDWGSARIVRRAYPSEAKRFGIVRHPGMLKTQKLTSNVELQE